MYFGKSALLLLLTTQVVEGFVTSTSRRSSFGIVSTQRSTAISTFSEVDAEATTAAVEEGDSSSEEATPEALEIEDAVAAAVAEATGTADAVSTTPTITDSISDGDVATAAAAAAADAPEEEVRYTMYCKNIPFETTQVELTQLLSTYGVINKVIMPTNPNTGSSRGFAFVDFDSQETLDKAIKEADGIEVNGRVLQCMPSLPQDQRPPKRTPGENNNNDDDRKNKVYVGNLPFGLENAALEEVFGAHGTVTDVYLMKDRVTGQDKGFGFITMSSEEEVEKAIEAVNGSFFQGRRLVARVPLARGERNPRKDMEAGDPLKRLYIGNLDYETSEEDLLNAFNQQSVEVKTVYVARNPSSGVSNGYGFASLSESEFAKATEVMNGLELNGREIKVEEAQVKVPKKRVYIGGINYATAPETIENMCREFGEVSDFFMPRNNEFDGHKGFAIATFESSVGEQFIADSQDVEVDGYLLTVAEARPKGEAPPRKNRFGPPPDHPNAAKLYVGNLSFYTPAETLQSAFEEFGEVYEVYMPQESSTGSSRGFAFVSIDKEGAANAVKELNDAEVDGRYIVVDFAQPRSEKPRDGGFGDAPGDEF